MSVDWCWKEKTSGDSFPLFYLWKKLTCQLGQREDSRLKVLFSGISKPKLDFGRAQLLSKEQVTFDSTLYIFPLILK